MQVQVQSLAVSRNGETKTPKLGATMRTLSKLDDGSSQDCFPKEQEVRRMRPECNVSQAMNGGGEYLSSSGEANKRGRKMPRETTKNSSVVCCLTDGYAIPRKWTGDGEEADDGEPPQEGEEVTWPVVDPPAGEARGRGRGEERGSRGQGKFKFSLDKSADLVAVMTCPAASDSSVLNGKERACTARS